MSETITSLSNPRIKDAIRLLERRARKQTGLTRIDGGRELLRALAGGVRPQVLFVCPSRIPNPDARAALDRCEAEGIPIQEISEPVDEKLAFGDRHEGLCAIVEWRPRSLDELQLSANPLLLVVEAVEKPGNLGALLRTADAVGVDAVIACDTVTDPTNPNVIRASMGTLFTLPVAQAGADELQSWLANGGISIHAATPEADASYFEADLSSPCAVVVGAEHGGLSPAWSTAAVHPLRIPMAGISDSLNVSVAAGIMLYEAVRQRSHKPPH